MVEVGLSSAAIAKLKIFSGRKLMGIETRAYVRRLLSTESLDSVIKFLDSLWVDLSLYTLYCS